MVVSDEEQDLEFPLGPTTERESFFHRMRVVFWPQHQMPVGLLLGCCLIGMAGFFAYQSIQEQGLLDIDQASQLTAEFQVDINSAHWAQFEVLPGVGEKLARAIVEHRELVGRFESLEQLQAVPGVGPKKFESLKPYLLPLTRQ